jgi:hypothetical protein
MKSCLISVLATLALVGLVPSSASAADLYGDDVQGVIIDDQFDDGPVVVERERIIERRYYGAREYREYIGPPPVEVYARRYRPADYPERHYWHAYDQW